MSKPIKLYPPAKTAIEVNHDPSDHSLPADFTVNRLEPLNGCMCQDGSCKSCNWVMEAWEAMRQALRRLHDAAMEKNQAGWLDLGDALLAAEVALHTSRVDP